MCPAASTKACRLTPATRRLATMPRQTSCFSRPISKLKRIIHHELCHRQYVITKSSYFQRPQPKLLYVPNQHTITESPFGVTPTATSITQCLLNTGAELGLVNKTAILQQRKQHNQRESLAKLWTATKLPQYVETKILPYVRTGFLFDRVWFCVVSHLDVVMPFATSFIDRFTRRILPFICKVDPLHTLLELIQLAKYHQMSTSS